MNNLPQTPSRFQNALTVVLSDETKTGTEQLKTVVMTISTHFVDFEYLVKRSLADAERRIKQLEQQLAELGAE